jgi:hypothetical protein
MDSIHPIVAPGLALDALLFAQELFNVRFAAYETDESQCNMG